MASCQPDCKTRKQQIGRDTSRIMGGSGAFLLGAFLLGNAAIAGQPSQLVAQRIVETLPPPPPIVNFGQPPAPGQSALPGAPIQERVFQAPASPPAVGDFRRYRVYINGDSSYLLQQVRQVEPQAFIQQYNGRRVIQAGIFNTEANARQQVALFNNQGIRAEITTSAMGTGPALENRGRGYLVVVPARREDLPQLRDQAVQMGIRRTSIRMRERPLGPHLAIGPFSQIGEAESAKRFLRDRGRMDARVYFDQ